MKKLFILLFAFAAFAISANAQVVVSTSDTVTNVDTTSSTKMTNQDAYLCYSIQAVVTRQSGAAGGKAWLYGSNDGVNFILTGDSITIVNGTVGTGYILTPTTQFKYYKMTYFQTATGVSAVRFYWYYKNN